jgi:hypothetical protein
MPIRNHFLFKSQSKCTTMQEFAQAMKGALPRRFTRRVTEGPERTDSIKRRETKQENHSRAKKAQSDPNLLSDGGPTSTSPASSVTGFLLGRTKSQRINIGTKVSQVSQHPSVTAPLVLDDDDDILTIEKPVFALGRVKSKKVLSENNLNPSIQSQGPRFQAENNSKLLRKMPTIKTSHRNINAVDIDATPIDNEFKSFSCDIYIGDTTDLHPNVTPTQSAVFAVVPEKVAISTDTDRLHSDVQDIVVSPDDIAEFMKDMNDMESAEPSETSAASSVTDKGGKLTSAETSGAHAASTIVDSGLSDSQVS